MQREKIVAMYDERFYRMWMFYLAGAATGFGRGTALELAKRGHTVIAGVQIAPQATDGAAVPRDWTRGNGIGISPRRPSPGSARTSRHRGGS